MEEKIESEEETKKNPLVYIISLFLIFLMVVWIIPNYAIKLDPEPKRIPEIEEVVPNNINLSHTVVYTRDDFLLLLKPNNPIIKQIADKITSLSCESSKICHAKAMYYFVRDNIKYVSDPPDEYIEEALEVLFSRAADCDGMAILLANLEQAVGIKTRFVFIPQHVYLEIMIPNYRKSRWIPLDPTCKDCDFGEIPVEDKKARKSYL